jgi:hypothetical protein
MTSRDPADSEVLLDEPLVADSDVDNEMDATREIAQLSDEEVAGARLLLTRKGLARLDDGSGVVMELAANFDRPHGAHMASARIQISIASPEEATFADIAPVEVRDTEAVKFSIKKGGSLSIKVEKIEGKLDAQQSTEFNRYYCRVEGSGAGTHRAVWTFYENPQTDEGVNHANPLMVTLKGAGPFTMDIATSCRIVRPGIGGLKDRIRELVLGPQLQTGRGVRSITIDVPPQPPRGSWWSRLTG